MHDRMGQGNKHLAFPLMRTAPWSPSLAGSYEGIALAKPPLVKEITVKLPKSKSLIHQGALEKATDDRKTKDLTGPHATRPLPTGTRGPEQGK